MPDLPLPLLGCVTPYHIFLGRNTLSVGFMNLAIIQPFMR